MKKYINFNGGPWHEIIPRSSNPSSKIPEINNKDSEIKQIDLEPGFFMEGVTIYNGKSVNSVIVHTFKYVPTKGIDKPRTHLFDDRYYERRILNGRHDKIIGELYDGGYRKKSST